MKTQIKVFINYRKNDYDGEESFTFFPFEMKDAGYITVMPYSFEVDIPEDFDPREKQVEFLKAKKQKAMADFQALVTQIDREISKLLCLEAA
jgi:hypothetical protein